MLHFFNPAREELRTLTREDPSAFAPPPAFGPFRVLHQVGVGALGPVFRTYEPTRDRLIAVKVFRLDITPEQAQSLADELSRAAEANLFHPSIVEPIAAGVEGTVAYRAEEYVAAESLDVAMRHYAPARLEKMLPFVTQLAGAIDFARAGGVGHGALHPRDIFVTPDEARAAGFGIVEALEQVGLRAPVRRPYTAPERIEGRPWGTPADVFSLAAITFELLTARRPAGTGAQIGPLTDAVVGTHENAVHDVLARAMDEDPERRYRSALGFAAALEAAARGAAADHAEPAAAGQAKSPEPHGKGTGRLTLVGSAAAADYADTAEGTAARGASAVDETAVPEGAFVDERVVRPEGEEAFTEPEPVDDIAAEREEDEQHHALVEAERRERDALQAERDRTLFDETAPVHDEVTARYLDVRDEDLPLRGAAADADVQDDSERTARSAPREREYESAAYSAAALASVSGVGASGALRAPDQPGTDGREGFRILPLALTLVAGLLLGFGAGYFVGDRRSGQTPTTSPAAGTTGAAATPQQPSGREWSEQAISRPPAERSGTPAQPPSTPPPVPAESPSRSAAPPARTEPSPPAAARGRLIVQSSPARAGVTVNGDWRGRTPLTLDDLPFGHYTVRVVQPGFTVANEQVTLSRTQPARTLSFALRRTARPEPRAPAIDTVSSEQLTGVLYVDSRPRGAQVFVDGRLVGRTPLKVPEVRIGSHVVRLELLGHARWSTSTTIVAGQEARVTGSLDPIQ